MKTKTLGATLLLSLGATLAACGTTQVTHHNLTSTVVQKITPTSQDPSKLTTEQRAGLKKDCTQLVDLVETQQYIAYKLGDKALQDKIAGYQKSFNTYAHKHFSFANNPVAMDIAYRSLGHQNDLTIHQDIKNYCSAPIFNEVLEESPNHLGLGGRENRLPNWELPA